MSEERLKTFIGAGLEYSDELDHLMLFVTQTMEDLKNAVDMIEKNDHKEDIKNYIEHNIKRLDVFHELSSRTLYQLDEMLRSGLKR